MTDDSTQVIGHGPLDGIKILDLTHFHAGPYGTMILGDMGADVIKVEPLHGDSLRSTGNIFVGGESTYFLTFNRNKRSITVDSRTPEGHDIVLRLASNADVVVHNFRPGVVDRLGLTYGAFKSVNEKIIYVAISGFGQTGPYRTKPAVDSIVQGMSGLMSITGPKGGEPTQVGSSIADTMGSFMAVRGVLLAIVARERYGIGQEVNVSMLDGTISLLAGREGAYFAHGEVPAPHGNVNRQIAPWQVFRTRDSAMTVTAPFEKSWENLCRAIGNSELATDPRFFSNALRVDNRDSLVPILQEAFGKRTTEEWMSSFEEHDVLAGPILDLAEVFEDPQVAENEMILEFDHPTAGNVRTIGIPIKMTMTPGSIRRPPPLLGQHTREVLASIGIDDSQYAQLVEQGIVGNE